MKQYVEEIKNELRGILKDTILASPTHRLSEKTLWACARRVLHCSGSGIQTL